jgi:general secretion pathway protein B
MSLILEALRKSEAERRRGQAPGLFVEHVSVPLRRRRDTPVWVWALVVMLAGVLLAWGWREFGSRGAMTAGPAAGDSAGTRSTPAPAAAVAGSDGNAGTSDELVSMDAASRDAVVATRGPRSDPLPPAATPRDPQVTADPASAATAPIPATSGAPSGPTSGAGSSSAVDASTGAAAATRLGATGKLPVAAPASGRPSAVADAPRTPAGSAPSIDTATAGATPPGIADDPPLPRLSELTGDERSHLPALKLSMHVFAEDPAQRFVILDGRRLREGDSPAAGVVLEAIRRDGLVISVNGRRLLLARP